MNKIVYEDINTIVNNLGALVYNFENSAILITGYKGFLGTNFCAFFYLLNSKILKKKAKIMCVDNKIVNLEDNTTEFTKDFKLIIGDIANNLPLSAFDYIIHCAGIASPTFYRKYPLETIDVNAISFFNILKSLNVNKLKAFLYFSSSEIYGNPEPKYMPTSEEYNGNVSCVGPRACYDESKRLGETIAVSFVNQRQVPIKIVRPFNAYGLFMRLDDKRVIPDFVKSALTTKTIKMYSNGSPTRAFCYSSDAIEGFLRALLLGKPGRPYNIGNDIQEISIYELTKTIAEIVGDVKIERAISDDQNYLKDNPQRRLPNIKRAKKELKYFPKVSLRVGLIRMINWYKENYDLNR